MSIVQVGDPILRRTARELSRKEVLSAEIQDLIAQMRETMRAAPGVGLAAPQIGLLLRIAVIEDLTEYHKDIPPERLAELARSPVPFHAIINPKIVLTGEPIEFFEGCLSMAGFSAIVTRSSAVRVECWNAQAEPVSIEASGWYARILQHEIDHLNGTLYIDRMKSRSLSTIDNLIRHWKMKPINQVKAELELG